MGSTKTSATARGLPPGVGNDDAAEYLSDAADVLFAGQAGANGRRKYACRSCTSSAARDASSRQGARLAGSSASGGTGAE